MARHSTTSMRRRKRVLAASRPVSGGFASFFTTSKESMVSEERIKV